MTLVKRFFQILATLFLVFGPVVGFFMLPLEKAAMTLAFVTVICVASFGLVPLFAFVVFMFALAAIWSDCL